MPVIKKRSGSSTSTLTIGSLLVFVILIIGVTFQISNDNKALVDSYNLLVSTVCDPATSQIKSDKIIIDYSKIRNFGNSRLGEIKQFTTQEYERFFMEPPGKEHYTLMRYMIHTFAPSETQPCAGSPHKRHIVDIGTRYVASALALGSSHGTVVKTFDLPNSQERTAAFRGKLEDEWQTAVKGAGVNIEFKNENLAVVPEDVFKAHTATWFISLDTHHLPYTVPFEREFFKRLADSGYKGLLFLDDIHLNPEMKKWWAELKENAPNMGYRYFDLTPVGHATGSGLIDFSGKVEIVQ